jgi:NADPH-dependent 2,4-dienoyl-CoA reductase/sulfur reductase-like enzyme
MTRLLVAGGDAAGMSAASRARRADPTLEIVAFEATDWVSYSACGLPYYVGGLVPNIQRLIARTPEQFAAQGIEVRLRHRVVGLDPATSQITVEDEATGQTLAEPFDRLVIATGARPRALGAPGEDLPGIFVLRGPDDAVAMREWAATRGVKRTLVVGAGYIGLEMAEALLSMELTLTIAQRSGQVLPNLDEEMARLVEAELGRQGATLLLHTTATAFEGDAAGVRRAHVGDADVDVDLVVVAVGIVPNADFAAQAGIPVGPGGAIMVDDHQLTAAPHVYSAGDCAVALNRVTGRPGWVPLGTTANKQGRVAGINAAGGEAHFAGTLGTAITRVCDVEVARTGLSLLEARSADFDAVATTIRSTDIAGYYPGSEPLWVRLVGERGTGRLLGGQLVGKGALRVDAIATALWGGLTVDDVGRLDLAYAPPFSSVWDPVLVAAQELEKRL